MTNFLTNFDLSLHILSFLKQAGVDTLVVCAGARNAPLVLLLQQQQQNKQLDFKIFNYFEERSAAFFALGLIKANKKPVAVLTTSGTAVAELLPATIESYYQGQPLILITADRPKRYRGSGSPQTIEQVGLFTSYVETVYDLDVQTEKFIFNWGQKKPLHLNVAFDEPLIDKPSDCAVVVSLEAQTTQKSSSNAVASLAGSTKQSTSPLIILGEIQPEYKSQVIEFLVRTRAPVYAESLSQIKNSPEIKDYVIYSSELLLKKIFKLKLCDSVIRIGRVPTLRFWRDLEQEFKKIPVDSYTDLPFTGLSRESNLTDIYSLWASCEFPVEKLQQIKQFDLKLAQKKEKLLQKYPLSEQSLTHQLSDIIKTDSLYLGNSLPIRNWDHFANCNSINIYGNRGANGIDGQISTYLGWSENEKKSYCYIGDLTAMYDLAALGLRPQLRPNQRNIIVLNNFGGQIFNRVFKNNNFINAHATQFFHWAQMWGWSYLQISESASTLIGLSQNLSQLSSLNTPFNIIEVIPNPEQTELFWQEWDLLCSPV